MFSGLLAIRLAKSFLNYFSYGANNWFDFTHIDILPLFSFFCIVFIIVRAILAYIFFYLSKKSDNKIDLVFFICVVFILIFPISKINLNDVDSEENRNLAKLPFIIKGERINYSFSKEFENWINDRFRGRKKLISFYTRLNSFLMGHKENDKAIEGKEKWLFYKSENSVRNFQNVDLFTEKQLFLIKNNLEQYQMFLKKNGVAKLYILILPDKNRVYGEYYPDNIKKIGNQGRGEQLFDFLSHKSNLEVIYPLQELLNAKKENIVYYKNDTHWNQLGAFVGYSALFERINKKNPKIKVSTLNDYEKIKQHNQCGDLSDMLDIPPNYYNDVTYITLKPKYELSFIYEKNMGRKGIITKSNREMPKTLVFRDSFFSALVPFVSQSLGDTEYIWSYDFSKNLKKIIDDKPQIVIIEMVERSIPVLLTQTISKKEV